MKNLIYYPTFAPNDLNWIKYALIYIDEFSPIVPFSGKNELSYYSHILMNETEILKSIEPTSFEGESTTSRVAKEIESIKRGSNLFPPIFGKEDVLQVWSNAKNWTSKLYEEKFSTPFKQYCIDNKFGRVCDESIMMSEELAGFYMTFLAEEIAYRRQASPITDNEKLDELSTYLRTSKPAADQINQAIRAVIDISLPKNLENIDLSKLIDFRNRTEILELRREFNSSVEKFYSALENISDPFAYSDYIKKTNWELIKEIGLFFGGTVSALLGGVILINSPNTSGMDIWREVLNGTILSVTGVLSISKAWELNHERRSARKFLSKLSKVDSV